MQIDKIIFRRTNFFYLYLIRSEALNFHSVFSRTCGWFNMINEQKGFSNKWRLRIISDNHMIICIRYGSGMANCLKKESKIFMMSPHFFIVNNHKNPTTIRVYSKRIQKRFVTLFNLYRMNRCGQQADMEINE